MIQKGWHLKWVCLAIVCFVVVASVVSIVAKGFDALYRTCPWVIMAAGLFLAAVALYIAAGNERRITAIEDAGARDGLHPEGKPNLTARPEREAEDRRET